MAMFRKGSRMPLEQSGDGIDYKNHMKLVHPEAGDFMLCFTKSSPNTAEITFDIVDEENLPIYAGKEELSRISRRISEFLMDIKRVGWTFKHIL